MLYKGSTKIPYVANIWLNIHTGTSLSEMWNISKYKAHHTSYDIIKLKSGQIEI